MSERDLLVTIGDDRSIDVEIATLRVLPDEVASLFMRVCRSFLRIHVAHALSVVAVNDLPAMPLISGEFFPCRFPMENIPRNRVGSLSANGAGDAVVVNQDSSSRDLIDVFVVSFEVVEHFAGAGEMQMG